MPTLRKLRIASAPTARDPDLDAHLDLQEVLHHIYDAVGYQFYIYEGHPDPVLALEETEWARTFVPQESEDP